MVYLNGDSESFDFLGFTFKRVKSKSSSREFAVVYPSLKSLQREREKLREMTSFRMCFVPCAKLIERLNVHLRGWKQYYSFGYHRKAMRDMTNFAFCRVHKHLKRRSQRPYRPPKDESWYYHVFYNLGLIRL